MQPSVLFLAAYAMILCHDRRSPASQILQQLPTRPGRLRQHFPPLRRNWDALRVYFEESCALFYAEDFIKTSTAIGVAQMKGGSLHRGKREFLLLLINIINIWKTAWLTDETNWLTADRWEWSLLRETYSHCFNRQASRERDVWWLRDSLWTSNSRMCVFFQVLLIHSFQSRKFNMATEGQALLHSFEISGWEEPGRTHTFVSLMFTNCPVVVRILALRSPTMDVETVSRLATVTVWSAVRILKSPLSEGNMCWVAPLSSTACIIGVEEEGDDDEETVVKANSFPVMEFADSDFFLQTLAMWPLMPHW